jgi:hypothetical protein
MRPRRSHTGGRGWRTAAGGRRRLACRAIVLSSPGYDSLTENTSARVWTRAAYPAADDASPAAVGKLFRDTTRTRQVLRSAAATAVAPSDATRDPARARISRSTTCTRLFRVMSSSLQAGRGERRGGEPRGGVATQGQGRGCHPRFALPPALTGR